MDSKHRMIGIVGITGTVLCLGAVVVSALMQGFSPLSGFVSQLGIYPGRTILASPALVFNAGLLVFGLAFGIYMVARGLREPTTAHTVLGVFGALTAVLAIAKGMHTLNNAAIHYIIAGAFYASVFLLCALYIIFMLSGHLRIRIAALIVGALAALSSAAFAVFALSGSMSQALTLLLTEETPGIEPFALIGAGALLLTLVFAMLAAADAFGGEDAEEDFTSATKGTREVEF